MQLKRFTDFKEAFSDFLLLFLLEKTIPTDIFWYCADQVRGPNCVADQLFLDRLIHSTSK